MLNARLLFAILVCLAFWPAPCWSQDHADRQLPDFDALEQDLDWARWLLENSRTKQSDLDRIRHRTESILENARAAGPKAREAVGSLEKQLEALGSPPEGEDAARESLEVAAKRKELQEKLANNEGSLRRIELIETRGKELLNLIAQKESQAAAAAILSRDPSLFNRDVWRDAVKQAPQVPRKVLQLGVSTLFTPDLGYYTFVAIAVLSVTVLLRWLMLRSISGGLDDGTNRYTSALMVLIANGFMPAAGLVLAIMLFLWAPHIQPPQARLLESVLAAGAAFLIARAWIHVALFSYESPRLIKLDSSHTDPLARRLYVLTGIALLSFFLYQMARADIVETDFYRAAQFMLRVAIALLFFHMFPLIRSAMRRTHETEDYSSTRIIRGMYGTLFVAAWVAVPAVVVTNPVLLAGGYWKLADWLFFGVVGSGLLLLTLWLIRNALRELVSRKAIPPQRHHASSGSGSEGLATGALVWGIGIFNLALWLSTMICLFLIWGVPYSQIKTWTSSVLFAELSLAQIEISTSDVLAALGIFIGLVMLTRVLQRQLQERLLSWAPLDIGVRNALWSATGYIGILAATVASLLALGVNLSQLFLILGALSVGIGFGLQSVVHDFISGLILLLERPVRIGDWIAVEGEEGTVRRIGARVSLLKTTVDGDIWIPNSRLTSTYVTNWTLGSNAGYIRIVSALHIDTDEQKASGIILDVAGRHSNIATSPKPEIFMEKIDGESFMLTLHAVISNITDRFRTESDLRFLLKAAFREAGISYAKQEEEDYATARRAHTMPGKYALNRT